MSSKPKLLIPSLCRQFCNLFLGEKFFFETERDLVEADCDTVFVESIVICKAPVLGVFVGLILEQLSAVCSKIN